MYYIGIDIGSTASKTVIMDGEKKNSPFWYVEGEWSTNSDTNEVMVGKEIANTLGLSIGDKFKVKFIENKVRAVTPGQGIVFYNAEGIVIAGGFIEK